MTNHGEGENKHFHRFHGYDYSRGAAMMITIVTEPRRSLLGFSLGTGPSWGMFK